MIIIDEELKNNLSNVTLILSEKEIKQLISYANQLLEEKISSDHRHLSSQDYQKEITLVFFDPDQTSDFQPYIKKIIEEECK